VLLAQVYLSDLADLPRNPWALRGLQQVYEAQGTPQAAQKLEQVRCLHWPLLHCITCATAAHGSSC
jgi:hypothetical protein